MQTLHVWVATAAIACAVTGVGVGVAPAASADTAITTDDIQRCVKQAENYGDFKTCLGGATTSSPALTYECESTEFWQTPEGPGRKGKNCTDSNGDKDSSAKGSGLKLKDKKDGTTYTCDQYIVLKNGSVEAEFCGKPR